MFCESVKPFFRKLREGDIPHPVRGKTGYPGSVGKEVMRKWGCVLCGERDDTTR